MRCSSLDVGRISSVPQECSDRQAVKPTLYLTSDGRVALCNWEEMFRVLFGEVSMGTSSSTCSSWAIFLLKGCYFVLYLIWKKECEELVVKTEDCWKDGQPVEEAQVATQYQRHLL